MPLACGGGDTAAGKLGCPRFRESAGQLLLYHELAQPMATGRRSLGKKAAATPVQPQEKDQAEPLK